MEERARATSREAYEHIKKTGQLSRLRWRVYDFLYNHGPSTIKEAAFSLKREGIFDGSYSARFAELREMGFIQETGTTKDHRTGKTVLVWDVTTRTEALPVVKKVSARKQVAILNAEVRELVLELNKALVYIKTLEGKNETASSGRSSRHVHGRVRDAYAVADNVRRILDEQLKRSFDALDGPRLPSLGKHE